MFVVFDLETTGLSTTSCEIIQFAYCLFDSSNQFVRAENLYFYHEGMHWSQEAADNSHHLSLEFLKQYEDQFVPNVLKMYSVLNRANVIGHNSKDFDCPFVKNWLARRGLTDFDFGIQQDTMLAYKPVTKRARIKLVKLSDLCGYTPATISYVAKTWFGEDSNGAHDARYDVAATALLTLKGLNEGLITFERINHGNVDLSTDSNIELGAEEIAEKKIDPNGIVLKLVDEDDDGDAIYSYYRTSSSSEFAHVDVDDEKLNYYIARNEYIPIPLSHQSDDHSHYIGYRDDLTVDLTIDSAGDTLRLITKYVTVDASQTDIRPIIKNTFAKEV